MALREIQCPTCGNEDRARFTAEVAAELRRRRARLIGWRCQACQHVIPIDKIPVCEMAVGA